MDSNNQEMKGCKHKWKIIKEQEYSCDRLLFKGKEYGYAYILQCVKCGSLKNHKIFLGNELKEKDKSISQRRSKS